MISEHSQQHRPQMELSAAGPKSDNSHAASVPVMGMKCGEEENEAETKEKSTSYFYLQKLTSKIKRKSSYLSCGQELIFFEKGSHVTCDSLDLTIQPKMTLD